MLHARKDYNRRIQDKENIIPNDEPVFLIRAQDKLGPAIVAIYSFMLGELPNATDEMVETIKSHAKAMEDWQKRHPAKQPDMPEKESIYLNPETDEHTNG